MDFYNMTLYENNAFVECKYHMDLHNYDNEKHT